MEGSADKPDSRSVPETLGILSKGEDISSSQEVLLLASPSQAEVSSRRLNSASEQSFGKTSAAIGLPGSMSSHISLADFNFPVR